MEKIIFTAGILLLPAVCTTVGAAGAFLFRRAQEPRTQRMTSGMAAGIMLAASVWSLLLPAIERAERGVWPGWFPPTAGLVVGAVGLLRLEALAGRWFAAGPGHCGHMVLAVTLHNLPEGMVVGLAAALALEGQPGGRKRGAGPRPWHRVTEHPGGRGGEPAAAEIWSEPGQGLSGRGSLRAGGAAGRAAGPCGGRLGERGSALADECGRRVHGLRNGAGDDPAGR